jgi:hypothetical protein
MTIDTFNYQTLQFENHHTAKARLEKQEKMEIRSEKRSLRSEILATKRRAAREGHQKCEELLQKAVDSIDK